jgi:general secretion pathway protein L
MIAVATLAAVVIPLWQKREYVVELTTLAGQARGRAAVSETLRAELDARVADYNTALERKYAFPSALEVVNAVSKLLPDDTWLTQFELKTMAKGKETQRDLLVRGETANAGHLVPLFEESQLFAQAAPRSQTTKIQPGPGEIFDLGAQLKSRSLPTPLTLAVTNAPAEPPPPGSPATAPGAIPPTPSSAAIPPAPSPAATTTAPQAPPIVVPAPATTAPGAPAPATTAPGAPAPATTAPGATGGSSPAARSAAPPETRGRPADAGMPPGAGPLSPGLALPPDPGKPPGDGGGRKP